MTRHLRKVRVGPDAWESALSEDAGPSVSSPTVPSPASSPQLPASLTRAQQTKSKDIARVTGSPPPKPKAARQRHYLPPPVIQIGESLDWSVANTDFPFDPAIFNKKNPRTWPDTDNHKVSSSLRIPRPRLDDPSSTAQGDRRVTFHSFDLLKVSSWHSPASRFR